MVRGPGMWKFNSSLSANENMVSMMIDFLSQWNAPPEISNPCTTWEWLKYEIKKITIQFSKENVPLEKQMIRSLTKDLQTLTERADAGEDLSGQIASMRRELGEVEEICANKLILRSRTRWTHLGEKPTSYYHNLEKRKSKDKTLATILLDDRTTTSDPPTILEECRAFYEKLYSEDEQTLTPMADIINKIETLEHPRISEQDVAPLESPVTEEELKKALLQLNKNKCPGTDGLSPEFYAKFWEWISPVLLNSLSYSVENGLLSTEQRRGLITLVPKKYVERHSLANWCPITSLNTDYKVLTKVMALRLHTVLDKIISKNQTGFMRG